MGVPAFFRWLTRKYPNVITNTVEEKGEIKDGKEQPVDWSKENPNGVEYDNLYLDMNGIIHPCTHPEDKPAPKNENEMMIAIFEAIDRLMCIVRPRRLLYMAIDGVAPRAKMNQQRSRRFRASKENDEKIQTITRIRQELAEKGANLPPEKPKEHYFDSNCITPGTGFMYRLSKCLHYYVHERMNNNPSWRNIKVILSDSNAPGEGEHKIMDFIRKQRAHPDYDPNVHHCLCGADADLMMLGLATHESLFTIIREEFKPNKPKPCDICGQLGHEMAECTGLDAPFSAEGDANTAEAVQFIFVRLHVLREYLEKELEMPGLPFEYDFERCIDDWVFMCYFVGNDFLPHLPSLEIREGAIDRLTALYKKAVYNTGGYLTNSGIVNVERVQVILTNLGTAEDKIFKDRQQKEIGFKQREKEKKKRMKQHTRPRFMPEGSHAPTPAGSAPAAMGNVRQELAAGRLAAMQHTKDEESDSDDEPPDEVRLYDDGFKDRYYESKFDVSKDTSADFRLLVAHEYVLGLCWVLQYYYQGCPSWKWYFPFHYAPFASDFIRLKDVNTVFEKYTKPFNPTEQLMGVFPAASRAHVPKPFADLMINDESPIIDFYPSDFKVDLNGKKYAWQGVALLPFVDETRLLTALQPFYSELNDFEKLRNRTGDDRLYMHKVNSGFSHLSSSFSNADSEKLCTLNPQLTQGMSGAVLIAEDSVPAGGTLPTPLYDQPNVEDNNVMTVRYKNPSYPDGFLFPAARLPGSNEPPRVLDPNESYNEYTWFNDRGRGRGGQRGYGGGRGGGGGGGRGGESGRGAYSNCPPPQGLKRPHERLIVNSLGGNNFNDNRNKRGRGDSGGFHGGGGGGFNSNRGWGHNNNYNNQQQNSFRGNNRGNIQQPRHNQGGHSNLRGNRGGGHRGYQGGNY